MKLSRERKVLLAVAGAAGLLVLADQALLGGSGATPASASAAAPQATAAAAASPIESAAAASVARDTPMPPPPPHHRLPPPSLADRLAHAGRHLPDGTPDAFRPGPRWHPHGPGGEESPSGRVFDPQAFLDGHRLEAVTRGQGQATAMINGQPMHLGAVRRGMTLRQIDERGVVWAGHGMRLRDRLDPDR